jgi:hypothetical protein
MLWSFSQFNRKHGDKPKVLLRMDVHSLYRLTQLIWSLTPMWFRPLTISPQSPGQRAAQIFISLPPKLVDLLILLWRTP